MRILILCLAWVLSACSHSEPAPSKEPLRSAVIRHESHALNASTAVDAFRLEDQGCFYVASIQHSGQRGTLRIVAGTTENVSAQGSVDRNFQPCRVSVKDYQKNASLLLREARRILTEVRLTTFHTGTTERSPLLEDFHRNLALASLEDPAFIEVRRNGEKRVTLNQVSSVLITTRNLFADFIRAHQEIGLDLEYHAVEKPFRNRVADSDYRQQLLSAGAKPADVVLSGAGIYRFDIRDHSAPAGE